MKPAIQAVLAGAVAVIFAAAGFLFFQWQSGKEPPVAAGPHLLAATLKGLDDRPQPLEQWRGKVLVVNFWATWCTPCREEIPVFIQFQSEYEGRGVQLLGIAIDQKERVAPYAKDIGINYPVLIGGLEAMDLARQTGNRAGVLPYTVVVDRQGKAISTTVGVLTRDKLEILVKPLL